MVIKYRSSCGDDPTNPADAELCGHSAENFAEAALKLEPRGIAWSKSFSTVKAALYRAFGVLLSEFEQRVCDLFNESLACNSVELLNEWEKEYGLPPACSAGHYPTDIPSRQALVCAARQGSSVITNSDLTELLRAALQCPELTIEKTVDPVGICIRGITLYDPDINCGIVYHARVGGWTGGVGQPLMQGDASKINLLHCLMEKYNPAHVYWVVCDLDME